MSFSRAPIRRFNESDSKYTNSPQLTLLVNVLITEYNASLLY